MPESKLREALDLYLEAVRHGFLPEEARTLVKDKLGVDLIKAVGWCSLYRMYLESRPRGRPRKYPLNLNELELMLAAKKHNEECKRRFGKPLYRYRYNYRSWTVRSVGYLWPVILSADAVEHEKRGVSEPGILEVFLEESLKGVGHGKETRDGRED
ncbi:hypothetical protein B6U84_01555 [Candidatus Bathyarchaeota archaeon ex4484_40]|nr:MAG: hypothetical protein B6U84_01555 [Candidatus Bathyarchaeota archaeon ex4484_40]